MVKRYPYEIQLVQELKSTDFAIRQDFANCILVQMKDDAYWILNILQTYGHTFE